MGARFFHTNPNRPCSPPSLQYNGYRSLFPEGKAAGLTAHPHLLPLLAFMACYMVKFTFLPLPCLPTICCLCVRARAHTRTHTHTQIKIQMNVTSLRCKLRHFNTKSSWIRNDKSRFHLGTQMHMEEEIIFTPPATII